MKKLTLFLVFLVVVLVIMVGYLLVINLKGRNVGSVTVGNEYYATSTPWDGLYSSHILKKGAGTLGSVIITKAGDSVFYLLDATNTPEMVDAYATDTDMLVNFPTSATVGTYTFDINFNDGLYLYVTSGNTGTSTITYR